MKFIKLPVLCSIPEDTNSPENRFSELYKELAISTENEEERYWKDLYFSKKMLEEEIFSIYPRKEFEVEQTQVEFFTENSIYINLPLEELIAILDDTD